MQGLQNSITNYYSEIPEDWKGQTAISFISGFFSQYLLKKTFNKAVQGALYYSIAEVICQSAFPLLKQNKYVNGVSQVAIRNFTILTGVTGNLNFGLKITLSATSFKIVEFLLEPYVSKENLAFFSYFGRCFRTGTLYYENSDSALKASLIATSAKYALESSYPYLESLLFNQNKNPKLANPIENIFNAIEQYNFETATNGFIYLYGKPLYLYGLSVIPTIMMTSVLHFAKPKIKKAIKFMTQREVESITKDEVDAFFKEFKKSPSKKIEEISLIYQKNLKKENEAK